jgi:hypothetical protein
MTYWVCLDYDSVLQGSKFAIVLNHVIGSFFPCFRQILPVLWGIIRMSDLLNVEKFIDLSKVLHGDQFRQQSIFNYVGKSLGQWLEGFLAELGVKDAPLIKGTVAEGAYISGPVYVAEGAHVEPTAYIAGPTYIGPGAQVRHGAYIRGNTYIGAKAVVGHATEVKGSLFFDDAKAGHFAYVGDSVLGRDTNLGAGTKLANLGLRRSEVRVIHPDTEQLVGTGKDKFGAIMGDQSQTGCNSVLNPGTILMPKTLVLACTSYRGTLTRGHVGKVLT